MKAANPDASFGDIVSKADAWYTCRIQPFFLTISFFLQGKLLGNEWKQLSNDAKTEFEGLAEADKKRYQKEMEDYSPPLDVSAPKDDADEKKKADQSSKKETPKSPASPNKKRKTPPVSVASANLFAAFLKKKKTE